MCAELATVGRLQWESWPGSTVLGYFAGIFAGTGKMGAETQLRDTLLPMFVQTAVHSYVPFWLQPYFQCRYGRPRPSAAVRAE